MCVFIRINTDIYIYIYICIYIYVYLYVHSLLQIHDAVPESHHFLLNKTYLFFFQISFSEITFS